MDLLSLWFFTLCMDEVMKELMVGVREYENERKLVLMIWFCGGS